MTESRTDPSFGQPSGPRPWTLRPADLAPYVPFALFAVLVALLAFLWKTPCRYGGAWNDGSGQFLRFCYTDIYPLWWNEKLAEGAVPYFDYPVEYPVGIGFVMEVVRRIVGVVHTPSAADPAGGVAFYDLTVLLMAICLLVGVVLMATLAGPGRRADALWYALAPGVILTAYINWDLLCGALTLGGLLAWSRRRPVVAGVLLGLAVSTKFYPLVLFGALLVLTLRTGLWRPFLQAVAAALGVWLLVNLPIAALAFDGWKRFYAFSDERPADWGSLWYFFQSKNWPILGNADLLDTLGIVSLGVLCLAIAVLGLAAPRRPRLAQLCFLVLASFMLTNTVWSPQFVLWLEPLAVLARPNWKPLALWQAAVIWYFLASWLYLVALSPGQEDLGISADTYFTAVWARALTMVIMMAFEVRDILRPDQDVIRRGGVDDPQGGVFDQAEDRFVVDLSGRTAYPPLRV